MKNPWSGGQQRVWKRHKWGVSEPRPHGGLGHEDMRLALAWTTWSFEERPEGRTGEARPFTRSRPAGK